MKKLLAIVLTICMCSMSMLGMAEAGVYEGAAQGFGGEVKAALTVNADGVIEDAVITGEGETPAIGGAALETLKDAVIAAQGAEFDAVAGATITSNAVKEAVTSALKAAGLVEAEASAMKAGTYTYAYRGYCSDVTVATTLSENAIVSVEIVAQDETEGIGSYALERVPGAIVENQTAGVDGVSGATATSNAILASVRDALREAGADMAVFNAAPEAAAPVDETYDTDVVVIGAGAAGFAAAVRALEEGASVIVVEKMDIPGGNTVRSSGAWNSAGPDQEGIDALYEKTMTGGHNLNNPDLVRVMVENSWKIAPWLTELGFEVNEGGGTVKGLARGLITKYWEKTEEMGGKVLYATKAEEILMKDGAAAGIVATSGNGGKVTINAMAVVIASGGFGYDLEKCYELKPDLSGMITNNQVGATGDGIYMAQAVGANLINIEQIQAHPTVEQSTATLVTEGVRNAGGILLNAEGKRFTNEVNFRDIVAAAILEQPGAYAYVVFNQDLYDSNGNIPTYDKVGVVAHCADTAEIAAYIGCDEQAVADTFAAWNTACENKNDPEFASAFTWSRNIVAEGPWYVIKIAPGIHHTMGGIEIDVEAQVISTEGNVIPGLYAAGEVTGGVHGGNRVGGNALMDCQVFGIIAGENAAAYVK
ncbi:MAG: flavocytochrome c [Clostridia bacterium]|nr:flavocytochrome c [Clostridia bacterium]